MSDNKKIRIAIVGCGKIAEKHLLAINNNGSEAELIAVCDTNIKVARVFSDRHGVPCYPNLAELLSHGRVDVVSLCTPSGLHAEQTILASKSGCHVISEKPMATRWQDGRRMVETCDQNKTQLFVVKQNRLNPVIRLLKRAITMGRFGRIYMVNVNVFWTRPQSYYDGAPWRGTWEFDGGAIMNQASHYVDLLDWLIGPVESVQAYTATLARNIEVEDTGVINIRWRSGALGSMNVTTLTYPKNLEASITVLGEMGTVKIGGTAANRIEHWQFMDKHEDDSKIEQTSKEATDLIGLGHVGYYKNVISVLRGTEKPVANGREGLRSLELLIAVYLSARDYTKVSLPLTY